MKKLLPAVLFLALGSTSVRGDAVGGGLPLLSPSLCFLMVGFVQRA